MLIQGDSDNWNPYFGSVGMLHAIQHKPLWREFRQKGYIRLNEAGEPYWYFETRQVQRLVFQALGLRFAEENAQQFNRMNREIMATRNERRWSGHKDRWLAKVENDLALVRRQAERRQVARVRLARRLGLIA